MFYIGDFAPSDSFNHKFHLTVADVPTALTVSSFAVFKNSAITAGAGASAAGLSITSTGALVNIALTLASDTTFYASGSDYSIVISAGSTGAVNVANTVVGNFSILHRSANVSRVEGTALVSHASGVLPADVVDVGGVAGSGVTNAPTTHTGA